MDMKDILYVVLSIPWGQTLHNYPNPPSDHIGNLGNLMLGYQLFEMLAGLTGRRGVTGHHVARSPNALPALATSRHLETLLKSLEDYKLLMPFPLPYTMPIIVIINTW